MKLSISKYYSEISSIDIMQRFKTSWLCRSLIVNSEIDKLVFNKINLYGR